MRDEHGDASGFLSGSVGRGRVALEEFVLGGRVQRGRRFVEDQQQGSRPHQGAGQADGLPLAAGKFRAWLVGTAYVAGQAAGDGSQERGRVGAGDRCADGFLVAGSGDVAVADALAQSQLNAGEVLEQRCDPGSPLLGAELGQVGAVDQDLAAGRRVQAAQQLHQRGLAGAVLADQC